MCHRRVLSQVRFLLLLSKRRTRPEDFGEFVYLVQQNTLGFHTLSVFKMAESLVQGQDIKTTNCISCSLVFRVILGQEMVYFSVMY
jgi:hypothetical protein